MKITDFGKKQLEQEYKPYFKWTAYTSRQEHQ